MVYGQPKQKVLKIPSPPIKTWVWQHVPVISVMQKAKIEGSQISQAWT
jgi:hypothetical protein